MQRFITKRVGIILFNTPDRSDEYIYSHDIPDVFNVSEKEYDKTYDELFHLSVELQEIFIKIIRNLGILLI